MRPLLIEANLATDLHTRNIVPKASELEHMSEDDLESHLGRPETADILRIGSNARDPNLPAYLVRPASRKQMPSWSAIPDIRIIDYGEAFMVGEKPHTLRTPLPVRAPEALLQDNLDYRVDLWSAGCAVRR